MVVYHFDIPRSMLASRLAPRRSYQMQMLGIGYDIWDIENQLIMFAGEGGAAPSSALQMDMSSTTSEWFFLA